MSNWDQDILIAPNGEYFTLYCKNCNKELKHTSKMKPCWKCNKDHDVLCEDCHKGKPYNSNDKIVFPTLGELWAYDIDKDYICYKCAKEIENERDK